MAIAPWAGLEANGGPVLVSANGDGAICNSWSWMGFGARHMIAAQVGEKTAVGHQLRVPCEGFKLDPRLTGFM